MQCSCHAQEDLGEQAAIFQPLPPAMLSLRLASARSGRKDHGQTMKMKPSPLKSLFLAPLSGIPAFTLAGLGSSDAGIASDLEVGLLFSVLFAIPMSFMGLVLVGLPLFILLRRHDTLLLVAACIAGSALPYAMFWDAPTRTVLCAIATGFTVGITAYFLRPVIRNNEPEVRPNTHQI